MIETLDALRGGQQTERWIDALDASLVRHIRGADRALGHYLAGLGKDEGVG
jgi:hypothetical protein